MKLADRKALFAVAAASMAAESAGLREENFPMDCVGVCIGAGSSEYGLEGIARALADTACPGSSMDIRFFGRRILSGLSPLWLLVNLPNMVSAHVAIQLGIQGPNSTITTDWVAGAQAIGEAFGWIQNNEADAVLAGGAESAISPLAFAAYEQGGVFSLAPGGKPDQLVVGEGAAILVLEEREHALNRGAQILGEICSYASASMTATAGSGGALSVTMGRVMEEAGWEQRDLTAVAQATMGNTEQREVERNALRESFKGKGEELPLIDFKSKIGHTLAASGAIELALLLKLAEGARGPVRLLCNSLGYLGQAASLAVSSY
jgi:3-oxoacyl-[acyl-carrier-protein] synthase II